MAKAPKEQALMIDIVEIQRDSITVMIVGRTPLVLHRFSDKARQELLMPSRRKNDADKLITQKHQPYEECRAAANTLRAEYKAPTLFGIPAAMFKKAMVSAAKHIPGLTKVDVGQLIWVDAVYPGDLLPLWGLPYIFTRMVRNSDIRRTPDVRSRPIFPEWAVVLDINFISPNVRPRSVANLLAASGMIAGVGDGRQEKGSMSYGQFRITNDDDDDFKRIVKTMGRDAQVAAFETLPRYDDETTELLDWYDEEVKRREVTTSPKKLKTGNGHAEGAKQ